MPSQPPLADSPEPPHETMNFRGNSRNLGLPVQLNLP